jgi:hypothetical protein
MKLEDIKTESKPTDQYFTAIEISEMCGVSYGCIKERIHRLEIFPDAIKGKARLFSMEKAQAIISQIKYKKRTYYQIFESKLNYETE